VQEERISIQHNVVRVQEEICLGAKRKNPQFNTKLLGCRKKFVRCKKKEPSIQHNVANPGKNTVLEFINQNKLF